MKDIVFKRLIEILADYDWIAWTQEDLGELGNEFCNLFVKMNVGEAKKS